jgi:hypothetical protein
MEPTGVELMTPTRFTLTVLLTTILATPALALAEGARAWMSDAGYVPPTTERLVVCHGYGCTRREVIAIDTDWFARIGAAMRAGRTSPAAEREALRAAIRTYTASLSRHLGGEPDAAKSPPSLSGVYGQMDCLDVSANTTSLLLVLKDRGLMVHHNVEVPASRGFFLDGRYPHTTAVISDTSGGTTWAVDPWSQMPGGNPEVVPLERWKQEG